MLDSGRWTDLSLLGLDLGLGSGGSGLGDSGSLNNWSGSGDLTRYQLGPDIRKYKLTTPWQQRPRAWFP